jgi:hypothetical protein
MGWTNQQAETITGLAFTYLASTVLYSTGASLSLDSGATFTSEADIELANARLVSRFTAAPGTLAGIRMLLDGVAAVGNRLLTAAVEGDPFAMFTLDYDGRMEWGPGTGSRDIDLARSATGELELNGRPLAASIENINEISAGDTTSSTSFGNCGTAVVTGFRKEFENTRVRVDLVTSCYSTVPITTARFAVRFGLGDDFDIAQLHLNSTDHHTIAGTIILEGIAAGTYNVRPRWRRFTGTGTLTQDGFDTIQLTVQECA